MASTQSRCTCEPHSACLPACLLTRDMATSSTTDASEYETHDLWLQWPFHMLLASCSGSGKSMLTTRLVALSSRVMTKTPARVLVFYSHMQPAYRELARQAPCPVQLLDGAKHFTEQLTTELGTLVIVDDMQATHARLVSSWFTRWAHNYDSSIIHLVQNVFDKNPSHLTISLNATYIVLLKNPRDMSQVFHLDKQADAICILAKAQPGVIKQLVAGADKDLINTLSECAANILNGNMILQPHQKQRLSRHADALRALRRQTVSQHGKNALLMDCWPALWHRCSSRPCPLSWAVCALWSGGRSDAGISKKGRAGQRDLQYCPSRVGVRSLLLLLLLLLIRHHTERTTVAAAVCHSRNGPW